MITRIVSGREVVADEATPAPIKSKDGSPIYWHQVRTLLLDDGDTLYGCLHCDYTSPNPLSIRPHLNAHKHKRAGSNGSGSDGSGSNGDVQHVLNQLSRMNELMQDRDRWKQRAQKAERDLKAIRRAIGGRDD